jgi:peroxiredoxin
MKQLSILIGLMAAMIVFKSTTGCSNAGKETASTGYDIGDSVADFKLKNTDGKMVSMSDFRNAKGFIVVFTCNNCPYAKAYEQRIMELDKNYKEKGYPVMAINANAAMTSGDENYEKMKKRAAEMGYTFPYLIDEKQEVLSSFGATKTPHIYLLQKTAGGLKVRYIGTIDDNYEDAAAAKTKYVENAIAALEEGKSPNPAVTKAIGCSINKR